MLKIFKKLFFGTQLKATIIPRAKHCISRKHISEHAIKVLNRLRKNKFEAYLVGGSVRDLLLNAHPKDFDVVTNASPEQIANIFSNCRLIGRRFRLAHIYFGRNIIEVATFRAHHAGVQKSRQGMLLRDNVWGTIEEDVLRRDFTINALYYNIADFSVVDFVGGVKDLAKRQIKMIGKPVTRYKEDPVRMLRAIRFANKLDFQIESKTKQAIVENIELIQQIPAARMFEEYNKLFLHGKAQVTFKSLDEYGFIEYLFPEVYKTLANSKNTSYAHNFLCLALANTDQRVNSGKSVMPGFTFAAMLWITFYHQLDNIKPYQRDQIFAAAVAIQHEKITIPRKVYMIMLDIWRLQSRLCNPSGKRAARVFHAPKFRAGYDFLLLRGEAGDKIAKHYADWWTQYQAVDEAEKIKMSKSVTKPQGRHNRRRKN